MACHVYWPSQTDNVWYNLISIQSFNYNLQISDNLPTIVGLSLSEDVEYRLLELGCYYVCSCGLKHFIQETNHCFHCRNELVPTIKTPLFLRPCKQLLLGFVLSTMVVHYQRFCVYKHIRHFIWLRFRCVLYSWDLLPTQSLVYFNLFGNLRCRPSCVFFKTLCELLFRFV